MAKRSTTSPKSRAGTAKARPRVDAPAPARTLSAVEDAEERRYTPFARLLTEARGTRPQEEIAAEVGEGFSRSALSQLERSMRRALDPDDHRLPKLAGALGLEPEALRTAAARSVQTVLLPGGRVTQLHREVGAE